MIQVSQYDKSGVSPIKMHHLQFLYSQALSGIYHQTMSNKTKITFLWQWRNTSWHVKPILPLNAYFRKATMARCG